MVRQQPFFSIIVPTYSRPDRLTECLESLTRLEYPEGHYEVIVADDGSPASSKNIVERYAERLDVQFLTQFRAGPAVARNAGARQARGEFLAFTDDDCAPARDWLEKLSFRLVQSPKGVVGGRTINALTDNPYSMASQMLVDYLYQYYGGRPSGLSFFTSNNLALSANQFRQLGGFDESFRAAAAEDRDFCNRCRHCGIRMIYAPEAIVYHMHQLTFRSFSRQHFTYGRGASHFHQLRAQRERVPTRLEPLPFYLNLLRYPFDQPSRKFRLVVAMLLVLSQFANAAGFFYERVSRRQSTGPKQRLSIKH